MDPRLTPANDRVAAHYLKGQVDAPRYAGGATRALAVPCAALLQSPGGPRVRQVLMGEDLTVYDEHEDFA
ncbi:MAG: NLP/P60 hydrolase, partial [Halocynthiibacter sp.]